MKVVMIPSGFKECMNADEVAAAMAAGANRFGPNVQTELVPMLDGGEGFAKAITAMKGGELIWKKVTGPTGQQIVSHYGLYAEGDGRTAVIEMAAAAGLKLVPKQARNPLKTTTHGVGELVRDALNLGVDRIIIGCGDSGTSDGGAGMAQALGIRFLDGQKKIVHVSGGEDLLRIQSIDLSMIDPRLGNTVIDVACNWTNVLCGEKGVARVFGPQKGASPEQVNLLSDAFDHYAGLIENVSGISVGRMPGSGASGGLGAALLAFTPAILYPRFDLIMDFIQIEDKVADADLVITAEGSIDFQTPQGKIPAEVARVAKKYGVPVIAITGTIGRGAELNYKAGIDAYVSIIQKPATLEKAMVKAPQWIEESIEGILRQVSIGMKIGVKQTGA